MFIFAQWADTRSSVDIDNYRENYLALASKRKRLQIRLKPPTTGGSKMTFSSIQKDFSLGLPAEEILSQLNITDQPVAEAKTDEKSLTRPRLGGGALLRPPLAMALKGPGTPRGAKDFTPVASPVPLGPLLRVVSITPLHLILVL